MNFLGMKVLPKKPFIRRIRMGHLQGDLQIVFDALYDLGIIEPVLKQDWRQRLVEIESGSEQLKRAISVANECGHNREALAVKLAQLDQSALEILAMEVAREYAGFHTRQELH
jgi:hypothetical protein